MQHDYQRSKKLLIELLIKQRRPSTKEGSVNYQLGKEDWENRGRYNCHLTNEDPIKSSPEQGSSNATINRARKNCYNYQLNKENTV